MSGSAAPREWLSPIEIAEHRLPGVPHSARKVADLASVRQWASQRDGTGRPLARRRTGRGGGWEYHVSLLPPSARAVLTQQIGADATPQADHRAGTLWAWFDGQSDAVKAEAERRLRVVGEVEILIGVSLSKSTAVAETAKSHGISSATLWNWMKLAQGVPAVDRLPHLAPRRKGGGVQADIDPELWDVLLSYYLRLSQPSWESAYRYTAEIAAERGLTLPHTKTLFRRFEAQVDPRLVTLRRKGPDALRKHLPPQKRTVADLHAMELVNIDGHTCDVRVRFPDGKIGRPTMVAIQDVMSRKFLAWRHAKSEDTITARLCFADLFARYGIPKGLLADNGRAFASKWLTGGAKTRHRFKIREEEPVGLLTALGIEIHWALPYRGSSKPIERGFRDFCDAIAKHPAFEGAYTGNSPVNKPDNYGERAVDWETFVAVWDAGVAEHNRRLGRNTEMTKGALSFDQVFDASYAAAPIGKAGPEQLRMALYAADHVRANSNSGAVRILENSYWSEDLVRVAGQMVTVRFDPDDATQPVHVFDGAGRFVCTAELWERTGFLDAAAAKRRAKLEADHRKATKAAEAALGLLTADQLAAMMPRYADEDDAPTPSVIRPVRVRGRSVLAMKPTVNTVSEPAQAPVIDRIAGVVRRQLRAID